MLQYLDFISKGQNVWELPIRSRLELLIDYAYFLFCNQVAGGIIPRVDNEASMQLHLSDILLQVGRMNVFAPDEHFSVVLEKKIDLNKPTVKSPKRKARIDIFIELKKGEETASAAVELKYLKKSDSASTDARYSLYKDLQNLEQYASNIPGLYFCEIVYCDKPSLIYGGRSKFSLVEGNEIQQYEGDEVYKPIPLTNHYPIHWDELGKHSFLKLIPK